MPRRKRVSKMVYRKTRSFSPEMEAFLAGNDAAFADGELWRELIAEPYFMSESDVASLTPAEIQRLALMEDEQSRRREAESSALAAARSQGWDPLRPN